MENFNLQMEKIIESHQNRGEKPKLLLHSCCAPCSSSCIERVKDFFDVTIYYYNPNMDSLKEYQTRKDEQIRLCKALGIKCITEEYLKEDFSTAVKGLENEKEGGKRCSVCFNLRLEKTARKAIELGYEYFATTLSVSPLKNARILNSIGQGLQNQYGIKYLPSDFKKKGGYLRSIELSKEYNLYRQNYCGCEFSK